MLSTNHAGGQNLVRRALDSHASINPCQCSASSANRRGGRVRRALVLLCLTLLPLVSVAQGTVVAWGDDSNGQATVPADLTHVIAVSGGDLHSLALKSDGTVVGWGRDVERQATPPADLTGVTAIAAGGYHYLALQNALTPAMAITDLITYINDQSLKTATAKSLIAKLNACQSMQDAINLAMTQRDKNQITVAQADYLIAQAGDIMLLMGCQ